MAYLDEDILYNNVEEKYKVAQGEARKAYSDILDTICEIPKETVYMRLALKNCGVNYKGLSDEEMKKIYEEKCSGWGFNGY